MRAITPLLLLIGAVGSLVLMLRGGSSGLLLLLFSAWVVSPFVALGLAGVNAIAPSTPLRARLDIVALVVVASSLAAYSGAIPMPPGSRPAFPFLMVPLASWLSIAIVGLMTRRRRA